jgi:hypothetical protein
VTYELDLPDGRTLRTRISHPPDRTEYGRALWFHILRDQLAVTEVAFWACVRGAETPDRGAREAPPTSLPAEVAYLLVHRVGISEDEVAGLSREEAVGRLQAYWSEHHR